MPSFCIPFSVKINASVALKITKHASDSFPNVEYGPIYGIDETPEVINVTHSFLFPIYHNNNNNNNNNNNIDETAFNLRGSNTKFQNEYMKKLASTSIGVKLLGWFMCATGGKFLTQSVIDAMLHYQQQQFKENRDKTPIVFLVHDPSLALERVLSLRCFKLSDNFLKVAESDEKFITKNLTKNELNYDNILTEIPVQIQNSHLINLKIQEIPQIKEDFSCLELSQSTSNSTCQNIENLFDSIDHFNHNVGNFHYYQRSLTRELAKIAQWKQKTKIENANKLKSNPNLSESELTSLDENEWSKHFKLPNPPSRYENLIVSGSISKTCNTLEVSGATELIKTFTTEKGLDI